MRKKADKTRARIMRTAGKLFAKYGFKGVTVRQLAAKARVNQAAINYYFRDKYGLYCEVVKELVRSFETQPAQYWEERLQAATSFADLEVLLGEYVDAKLASHLQILKTEERWRQELMMRLMMEQDELLRSIPQWLEREMRIAPELFRRLSPGKDELVYRLADIHLMGQIFFYSAAEGAVRSFLNYTGNWDDLLPRIRELVLKSVYAYLELQWQGRN